jgi:hypothetical protein
MQRVRPRSLISAELVAVASIVACLFFRYWTPIEFNGSFLGGADNATQIINELFPFRLVQPSWLSQTNDLLIRWEVIEGRAREITVVSLWFAFVLIVILRDARSLRPKT